MKIHLPQLNKTLDCQKGENLFSFLRGQQVALASSCKGEGICGKCRVEVVSGAENLSPVTELESRLQAKYELSPHERISCQSQVLGDITLKTPYW